jgi:seryl-tRNA synthetase
MTDSILNDAYQQYLDELLDAKILVPTGIDGIYGKGATFENVLDRFDRYVTEMGRDQNATTLRFPPVVNRKDFERSDYLKSFPHLAGTVHAFTGTEADHRDILYHVEQGTDWTHHYTASDVVLTPAACYPVYPQAAGVIPEGGHLFDVQSYCFRHEPSIDPARMQMFRMHEYVRIGTPENVRAFRDLWLDRSQQMLAAVGLAAEAVVANDPFFGRAGRMLAANQRDQSLKFELVVPICSTDKPTAVVSCNYHQDHFGDVFGISLPNGEHAHTACVGFGLERITLALFKTHGFDIAAWPADVRKTLGL